MEFAAAIFVRNSSYSLSIVLGSFLTISSYVSFECGGTRTPDRRLWRSLLYQLSYTPNRRKRAYKFFLKACKLFVQQLIYARICDTVPAPIVLPPSRIANCIFNSIAIGAINSHVTSTLSPGITISTPSGSVTTPVTSVVLKKN